MANKKEISVNLGTPATLLTVLFAWAKIMGHIDWAWGWVLSPLWLPLAVLLGGLAVCAIGVFVFAFLSFLIQNHKSKRSWK